MLSKAHEKFRRFLYGNYKKTWQKHGENGMINHYRDVKKTVIIEGREDYAIN